MILSGVRPSLAIDVEDERPNALGRLLTHAQHALMQAPNAFIPRPKDELTFLKGK